MTTTADATESSTVEELVQSVKELQETVKEQANQIDELKSELAKYKDHTGREFADVRGRISDVEEQNQQIQQASSDETPGVGPSEREAQNEQTPLERICALPEHLAERELTANQERARFIARDVQDYAEKAPAGLVIDSRTIAKVITAAEGNRPHTQTVARVMDFLNDLGKKDVKQMKRRGRKIVIVDPEAAACYHNRCDSGMGETPSEGVIGPI